MAKERTSREVTLGKFAEIQGTAKHQLFSKAEMEKILSPAKEGIKAITEAQTSALKH